MPAPPMSLTAYARRRGVSAKAVSKAVASGRLKASVVHVDGVPKIGDPDIADVEWQANTRPRIDHPPPPPPPPQKKPAREGGAPARASTADDGEPAVDGELPPGVPRYDVSRAVREFHEARRSGALADVAEIERDQVRGEVIPSDEARAYMTDKFTIVKTRLLGVPSRVAQQLPELASAVEPVVDKLIREVLEELAAEDDGDGEEDEAA